MILAFFDLHKQITEQHFAFSRVLLRVLAVQQVEQFPSMLLDGQCRPDLVESYPPEDQGLPVTTDDSVPKP